MWFVKESELIWKLCEWQLHQLKHSFSEWALIKRSCGHSVHWLGFSYAKSIKQLRGTEQFIKDETSCQLLSWLQREEQMSDRVWDTNPPSLSAASAGLGNLQMFSQKVQKTAKNNKKTDNVFFKLTGFISLLIRLCSFIWIAGFSQSRETVLQKWKSAGGSGWLMVSAGASPKFSHLHPSHRVCVIEVLLNGY